MIEPDDEGDEKRHPAHVQHFILPRKASRLKPRTSVASAVIEMFPWDVVENGTGAACDQWSVGATPKAGFAASPMSRACCSNPLFFQKNAPGIVVGTTTT